MGHGHSHGGPEPQVEVGQGAKLSLIGFLVLVGVAALIGVIWFWPTSQEMGAVIRPLDVAEGVTFVDARIDAIQETCPNREGENVECRLANITVLSGELEGTTSTIEILGPEVDAGLTAGDRIEVVQNVTEAGTSFALYGIERTPVIAIMLVLFLICVFAVARLRGLMALVGLVVAGVLLVRFMLPAILVGKPGIAVALAGSTAIMFIVLYVAHGISLRTSAALAGTLLGLAVTTVLGAISVAAARLTGFLDDQEYYLAEAAPSINFRDLFMVGIIIGGLGVLNDVTITQASAVWELRAAAPHWSRRQVFASGMRIGRDHIASTIYTIVFAYAGSALTILLMLYFTQRDALSLFNAEMFAAEAVRTLGSAIGLILSVPITTGIAALTVGARHFPGAQGDPTTPARADNLPDFTGEPRVDHPGSPSSA